MKITNYAILIGLLGILPFATGCQPLDTDAASSSPIVSEQLDDAGLPIVFADADLSQPCPPNSALCYELCGSPSCALLDNTIPPLLRTPPIVLQDGGTQDPCVQLEAESMAIRQRSCSQCHGSAPGQASFSVVLDDNALLTAYSHGTPSLPLLVSGNPAASYVYVRIVNSIATPQTGMPPTTNPGIATSLFQTVVYPTPADISVMYAWIYGCVGPNAGGYSSSFYGGDYAPNPDGSVIVVTPPPVTDAGAVKDSSVTPVVDASVPPVDAGKPAVDSGTPAVDSSTGEDDSGGGNHPNLITNGNLRVVVGTGTVTTMGNGEVCVAVTANEAVVVGWPSPVSAPGVALGAGESYTFSYTALTTRAAVVLDTVVGDTLPPSYLPVDFESKSDPIGTTATTFTHPFTPASGADPSAGLSFSFTSTMAQSVCFENLSLVTN